MGSVNSLPIVSQIKSFVQWIFGDTDGAKKTQEDFVQECPIISQVTSMVQLIEGDVNGAVKTQKRFANALLKTANGIPIVGHVKGAIHYALGDKEEGKRIMIRATRTTAVMGFGAAGFILSGPFGAVVLGIGGGFSFDLLATIIDDKFSGYVAAFENIDKNPNAGDIFDVLLMPVCDGLAGYAGGTLAASFGATPLEPPRAMSNLEQVELEWLYIHNLY